MKGLTLQNKPPCTGVDPEGPSIRDMNLVFLGAAMNTKSNWQHHFFRYRCSMVFLYFGTAPTLENVASQPRPFFSCEVRESSESQKHGQAIPLTHILQKWRILSFFSCGSHMISPLRPRPRPRRVPEERLRFRLRVVLRLRRCRSGPWNQRWNGWKPHLRPQTVPLHHSSRS